MRLSLLLFLFLFVLHPNQAQKLSEQSKVSLLTISPGSELYSSFGHSAIRIQDPFLGLDQNYNYGTFDFKTPNFYIKFLRGQLPYQISSYPFYLEAQYWTESEKRGVVEQNLNLNHGQKQKLFELLNENLLPENRNYSYKFFYDNCSTRLRDILEKATDNQIVFSPKLHADSSYRDWIDKYSIENHLPWAQFGMSIAIGLPSDKNSGWNGAMFIPDNLKDALNQAKINNQPVVINEIKLADRTSFNPPSNITPNVLFWTIFIVIANISYLKPDKMKFFDKFWFGILGISGWIITLLWFGTDHGVTTNNMNIIWAFPLLIPFYFIRKTQKLMLYFYVFSNILLLIFFKFIPQNIPNAVVPIILTSLLRIYNVIKK